MVGARIWGREGREEIKIKMFPMHTAGVSSKGGG
jgi:hypothetical protein